MRFLTLLFFAIWLSNTQAAPCEVFRDAYADQNCYQPKQCGFNVVKLLDRLNASGENLQGYDVIFIMHELKVIAGGPTMATPFTTTGLRQENSAQFFRAHLLVLDKATGQALDLDYRPTPTPIMEYSKNMFGQSPPENLVVKRIGAQQYMEMVRQRNVQSNEDVGRLVQVLRGDTPAWPEARMQDIIDQYSRP